MYKLPMFIALATLGLSFSPAQAAGDAAAGKGKAAVCGACHGVNGISTNDMWPNLAGQKEAYLAIQLTALRDGTRKNPMMSPMAANLSDQDIADLAAYFSSLGK